MGTSLLFQVLGDDPMQSLLRAPLRGEGGQRPEKTGTLPFKSGFDSCRLVRCGGCCNPTMTTPSPTSSPWDVARMAQRLPETCWGLNSS